MTNAAFQWKVLSEEGRCGQRLVTLELALKSQTVYVASEVEPGTCTFAETVAHEKRHMLLNHQHLAQMQSRMRVALAKLEGQPDDVALRFITAQLAPDGELMQSAEQLHADFDREDEEADRTPACRAELLRVSARIAAQVQ